MLPTLAPRYGDSAKGVQAYLDDQVPSFVNCSRRFGARACAMRFKALGLRYQKTFYGCDQLFRGMYSIFVEEWLLAAGRQHVLLELSEDYFDPKSRVHVLRRVASFVNLRITEQELARMALPAHKAARNRSPGFLPAWRMPQSTREAMDSFYSPYNEALGDMLGDARFAPWRVFPRADADAQS